MTLTATTNRVQYNGDGATVAFAVTFVFWDDDDLQVIHTDSSGTETVWVRGTQFTVSGGDGSTGTVTVSASPTDYTPASGEKLTIKSNLSDVQSTSLPAGGAFPSASVEEQLDKTVRLIQQIAEETSRAVKFPVSSALSEVSLPATLTADAVLKVNAGGTAFENGPTTTEISDAETNATAAAASAAAAATSETNAGTSETSAAASAAAAAASAASNLFATVLEKDNGDSPYLIAADTDDGTMFICDMSSGSVAFNLPSIATAGEGERYGFLRSGASNTLTLVRNGSDTINGVAGDYTVTTNDGELVVLVADDAATDNWVTIVWSQAAADGSTLAKSGGVMSVADGGITEAKIADNAVTPEKAQGEINAQTGTAYTFVLTDDLKVITMDNASANEATIPTNASVAFEIGARIDVVQKGAGATTVTGDTGVTVNGVSAGSGALSAQYAGCSLIKIATDTWLAVGAIGTVA